MKNRLKFSLSAKAFLAVVIILLPILFAFAAGFRDNKEVLKKYFLDDLALMAEAIEAQVYQFLDAGKRRAQDFASDGLIISELERASVGSRSADGIERHIISNKLPLNGEISAIAVISPLGKVIVSSEGSLRGADLSKEDFFKKGGLGVAVSERRQGLRGAPDLAFSAPIRNEGGELIGVLVNFVSASELGGLLSGELARNLGALSSRLDRRETFEAYLVNRDRLMITDSIFRDGAAFDQRVDTLPVSACLERGGEMTGLYADYRGVEVAGASMCLPELGWTLLVEIDSSEALFPVSRIGRSAGLTALVVALLTALLFIVFHRRVVLKLQAVTNAAAQIAKGNYDTGLRDGASDEIGEIARAFNEMARQIKERGRSLAQSEKRLKSILDNSSALVYMKDLEGRYILVNKEFELLFRTSSEEMAGRTDHDLLPKEAADSLKENDSIVLERRLRLEFEESLTLPGGVRTYISMKFPLLNEEGFPYAICCVSTDITERKRVETALRESEERLRKAQELARMGSWEWDIRENTLWWSDEIYRIFGLKPREFGATYEAFLEYVHPDDREFVKNSVAQAFQNRRPYSIDHRIMRPDGTVRIVHEEAEVLPDPQGRPQRMIGTVQDLTEQKTAEFEQRKLSAVLEHSVNLLFITDRDGAIQYVNPTFEQVTGFTREEIIGQTPRVLSSGEGTNALYQELWNTILSGRTWRSTLKNRKRNGTYYWANSVITPIRDEKGQITHFLAVQEDVTEKMMNEERLNYLAVHDELTGLMNRSRFIEEAEAWMLEAGPKGVTAALSIIDMDQFKLLNDTFGHGAGDEYLRRLGKVIKDLLDREYGEEPAAFDSRPLLSRLSGDEYAVFFPGIDRKRGMDLIESIRAEVEGFYFAEASSTLTVSAGVAFYPDHGLHMKELLSKADAAMYRAKELGRNRTHAYRPEDQDLEKMHSRLAWKERIFKGIRENRFVPWFQPLLDLKTDGIHHYEALARLVSEDGKVLLPGAFIDIAERFGIVGLIDRVIIEKTMRTQAEEMTAGRGLSFGMNLSGKDLGDAELLDFIKRKILETGAEPEMLVFEITETAAIGDLEKAIRFVKSLKETGCRFSLDDFGVGFTSFTYLKEMPVDYIKIDGSFIRKLDENPDDQVLVKAMTEMARGLRIKTIAEFVENEKTLSILRSFGVDYAQGYLIGKPSPGLVTDGKESGPLPAGISG